MNASWTILVIGLAIVSAIEALDKAAKEPTFHDEELRGRHKHTEAIYWEARLRAEEERKQLPAEAFTGSLTDLHHHRNYTRIWDFYTPDYNCPLLKERVGRVGDGGKWVCGLRGMHGRPCLVYSLGSAGDISFEDELLSNTHCEVRANGMSTGAHEALQTKRCLQSLWWACRCIHSIQHLIRSRKQPSQPGQGCTSTAWAWEAASLRRGRLQSPPQRCRAWRASWRTWITAGSIS